MTERSVADESTLTPSAGNRFPADLMYAAAASYYQENITQADIAEQLGVSRPTVSRLLSEARRVGIVEITVHPPATGSERAVAERLCASLGLDRVYLVPTVNGQAVGRWLAPGVAQALEEVSLDSGDVLLVSSGLTLYHCVQQELPTANGVIVAPTVGGQEEPEPWYQTNMLATMLAERVGGRPAYLYAPALPSPALHRSLMREPSFLRVQELWEVARCALIGVGAAPAKRSVIPSFVPTGTASLRHAVGDICSRFYDVDGNPVRFRGSERLVAISVESLRKVPASIAVAAGRQKTPSIIAGARSGYFNRLVTDHATAAALIAASAATSAV